MKHIVYDTSSDTYPLAILVKAAAFNAREIDIAYVQPLEALGVSRSDIIIVALEYQANNKAPVSFIREYLETLMPALGAVGVTTLFCADSNYFKVLANQRKAEPNLGYKFQCVIKDYDHMEVVLGINHKALLHNPGNQPKLELGLKTLATVALGTYQGLGNDIIHNAYYPESLEDIKAALKSLHQHPLLAADLEAFSLQFREAGLGTAAFAWSEHEGLAFCCDYRARKAVSPEGHWGEYVTNPAVQNLVRDFLEAYEGTLIWHNGPYDLKILIYELYMDHPQDYVGMLRGLEVVTKQWHDTKIITYLAVNSTAGNELSLKDIAHPFAGNWANADINDIRLIPKPQLLKYNVVDVLSTFWTYNKHSVAMVEDDQLEIYNDIMMPSQKTIIQMELVGMPMDPGNIEVAGKKLQGIVNAQRAILDNSLIIDKLNLLLQQEQMVAANAKLKIKQHPIEHFKDVKYNPNSPQQTQKLLYEVLQLPVIDRTKTKLPCTGGDTLEKLINHTSDPHEKQIIEALIVRSKANKILNDFIPSFRRGWDKGDGVLWLHGSFNLGGTVSGRLSSSGPNMQNLPSGSTYGKLVKNIFRAPKGFIFCGADFASLEDRINALLTKDPNKLKVYTDGFDGHALRAYSYWPDKFPGLDPDDPASINTIKRDANGDEHPLRGESKAPSFALQYLGTWVTLVKNSGFTPEEAKAIETNFHLLYGVSMKWVEDQIALAGQKGYAEAAFGLRIRTPMLARTYLGKSSTPREAEAEARTLGNAVSGQSYGLLNNRAANAVMERVWVSPHRYDILPVAMIHDAIYFICKDDVDVVAWLNLVLVEEMAWQELPEIMHDEVKLGAELDLFYPSWAYALNLPNEASKELIHSLCKEHQRKMSSKESQAA